MQIYSVLLAGSRPVSCPSHPLFPPSRCAHARPSAASASSVHHTTPLFIQNYIRSHGARRREARQCVCRATSATDSSFRKSEIGERYDFVFVPNNVIPFSTLSRGSRPSTLYAYLCAVSSFTHQISSKNEHFPAPWREPRDATWTNQISKPLPSEFPVAGIYYVRFVRIL